MNRSEPTTTADYDREEAASFTRRYDIPDDDVPTLSDLHDRGVGPHMGRRFNMRAWTPAQLGMTQEQYDRKLAQRDRDGLGPPR